MRMRQIQAPSSKEAIEIARRELGDEAIILRTEKKAGSVIITFGVEDVMEDSESLAPPMQFAPTPSQEVSQSPKNREHPTLKLVKLNLEWHGVPATLVRTILDAAERLATSKDSSLDSAEKLLAKALGSTFNFSALNQKTSNKPLMLVGTPGAGKTFAIAKLAADAVKRKARLRIITTDTSRAAAYDQLAAFTQILNVPLDMADSPKALSALVTIAATQGQEVMIDTAGCNPYRFEELKALGELARPIKVEPVLVMPLGLDAAEAQETAAVFSFLGIERLILSRIDCARRFGGAMAALEGGAHTLCNITDSLRVADGCPPLTPSLLAQLLLRPIREQTR
jgi:flagellar biosynthesis protein FlhF